MWGEWCFCVAKTGVVVVLAYAGVQAHAIDDLAAVQPVAGGIGVQLVKKRHAHGQIGVGKELDGLGLGAACEQHLYVLLDCTFLQQPGKCPRSFALFAHYDAAGVKVVVQRFALAQKLGAEDDVWAAGLRAQLFGVAHGHGAFDDHDRLGGVLHHVFDHALDAAGVKVVGNGVVVHGMHK